MGMTKAVSLTESLEIQKTASDRMKEALATQAVDRLSKSVTRTGTGYSNMSLWMSMYMTLHVLCWPKNVVKGRVTETETHATFDHVFFASRVDLRHYSTVCFGLLPLFKEVKKVVTWQNFAMNLLTR